MYLHWHNILYMCHCFNSLWVISAVIIYHAVIYTVVSAQYMSSIQLYLYSVTALYIQLYQHSIYYTYSCISIVRYIYYTFSCISTVYIIHTVISAQNTLHIVAHASAQHTLHMHLYKHSVYYTCSSISTVCMQLHQHSIIKPLLYQHNTHYMRRYICLVQVQLRTEVLRTPSSTQAGFELMTVHFMSLRRLL